MYTEKMYPLGESNEYEFSWAGRYGAKGERREEKRKITPEQIKKQNHTNKVNYIRRIIKLNFSPGIDYWVTLTYKRANRPERRAVKKNLKKFLRQMRAAYKKQEEELKFIQKTEVGSKGAVHHHLVVNKIEGTDTLINKFWVYGSKYFEVLYEEGGFQALAEYIAKDHAKEEGEENEEVAPVQPYESYSTSRNLKRPIPEKKLYKRWTMKRILEEGPKPKEGFVIDKSSIVQGVNKYTGCAYLRYTEIKVKPLGHRRI